VLPATLSRPLLKRFGKLPLKLTITGTAHGKWSTVATKRFTVKLPNKTH
jgi:hypothetical protein